MCLWLGGSQTPGSCLGPCEQQGQSLGVEIEWGSLVLSSLGHAILSQTLYVESGLLKGGLTQGAPHCSDLNHRLRESRAQSHLGHWTQGSRLHRLP